MAKISRQRFIPWRYLTRGLREGFNRKPEDLASPDITIARLYLTRRITGISRIKLGVNATVDRYCWPRVDFTSTADANDSLSCISLTNREDANCFALIMQTLQDVLRIVARNVPRFRVD